MKNKKSKKLKQIELSIKMLKCLSDRKKVSVIENLIDHCYDEECLDLLNKNLLKLSFLNSKSFYEDMEMLSKANNIKCGLTIIGDKNFMDSPYHREDLKLISESKVGGWSLSKVAKNQDSICSSYHRADMELISKSCRHDRHKLGYLSDLATNKVSLKDKYHLENMQILSQPTKDGKHLTDKYLFEIMTNSKFVEGKNYRKEIEALQMADNSLTAKALHYYIVNPANKFYDDEDFQSGRVGFISNGSMNTMLTLSLNINDKILVAGSNDPEYVNNLKKINSVDKKIVLYYTSLLMNPYFIKSPYKDFDLNFLQNITDEDIFSDVYTLMSSKASLNSTNHKKEVFLVSKTTDKRKRRWIVGRLGFDDFIGPYDNDDIREYDMEYISKLNFDSIDFNTVSRISYYMANPVGIADPKHKEKLDSILRGEVVKDLYAGTEELYDSIYKEESVGKQLKEKQKSRVLSPSKNKKY
mgnify:FL=1